MKKTLSKNQLNRGFIQGAVLFGLLILSLVVGAFALANRGNSQNASTEPDKVNAAAVLAALSATISNLDRYAAVVGPLDVIFNGEPGQGGSARLVTELYGPSTVLGLTRPALPEKAFVPNGVFFQAFEPILPDGMDFVFFPSMMGANGVNYHYTIILADLTEGVCKQINRMLTGQPLSDPPQSLLTNGKFSAICTGENGSYALIAPYGRQPE